MVSHELPRRHKNYLFELVQSAGLDSREFTWETVKGAWARAPITKVTHSESGFFVRFDVRPEDGHYYPSSWPGKESQHLDDNGLKRFVEDWVTRIAPDLKAPDLWKLAVEQARIDTAPTTANTPFTPEEQKRIGEELFRLEEFVYQSEPSLPPEKQAAVKAFFQYLKDSAGRLGRADWNNIVISTFFQMAVTNIISIDTFKGLFHLAATLFNQVLSIGGAVVTKLLGS